MLNLQKLSDQLIRHEGMERFPYVDTVGKTTIGVGRNLTDRGLSQEECRYLLANDIKISIDELKKNFYWFTKLDGVRQIVLVDLHFNLGIVRLKKFRKTLHLIEICALGDDLWDRAAAELLDSKWARQVGQRARTLAHMLSLGDTSS